MPQPHEPQLLIVDDDPELRLFLAGELAVEGYGVEVWRRMRSSGDTTPVLMLTARPGTMCGSGCDAMAAAAWRGWRC